MKKLPLVLSLILIYLVLPIESISHNKVVVIPLGGGSNIQNVITVAKSGGDFTNLLGAVNSITDASASKPYAIYVAPGIYDMSTSPLPMKPYVSIIGSGQGTTVIKSSRGGTGAASAFIVGADNSHLDNLTIKHVAAGNQSISIYNHNTSPSFTNLEIIQASFCDSAMGIYNGFGSAPVIKSTSVSVKGVSSVFGIFNVGAEPVMDDIAVEVSTGSITNIAIHIDTSSPTMNNVRAKAFSGFDLGTQALGLQCQSSTRSNITNSSFEGAGLSVSTYGVTIGSNCTGLRIINSKIVGGVNDGASGTQCLRLYNGDLGFVGC